MGTLVFSKLEDPPQTLEFFPPTNFLNDVVETNKTVVLRFYLDTSISWGDASCDWTFLEGLHFRVPAEFHTTQFAHSLQLELIGQNSKFLSLEPWLSFHVPTLSHPWIGCGEGA